MAGKLIFDFLVNKVGQSTGVLQPILHRLKAKKSFRNWTVDLQSFTKENLQELFRYANALVLNEPDALDLVQTAMTRVLVKQPENLMAYTKTTIRHIFYDQYRRRKKLPMESYDETTTVIDLHERHFENTLIDRNTLKVVMEKLEPIDRELLFLYGYEGLTFDEIAEKMNKKRGTLLSRMHRIKSKVKKIMNRENYGI